MKEKVCLTTYVWGDKYQLYIPIAVFSIKKMYPEYDIIIFLHGKLNEQLRYVLEKLNLYEKITIKENTYSDCPKMNTYKAKAFRWVLWDSSFLEYDYIYVIDIDMFYVKEPLDLHKQHIYHMKNVTGLPFDNMRRVVKIKESSLKFRFSSFLHYVKNFGIKYLYSYIRHINEDIYRLSGLHFIDVKKYYATLTVDKLSHYRRMIYDGSFAKILRISSDEPFLYFIMKDAGFHVDKLALQDYNDENKHLNFDNYDKDLFRPTHGIHMGIFRSLNSNTYILRFLNTETYGYYKKYMIDHILCDEEFRFFLNIVPDEIRKYFERYFSCIGIDYKL